MVSLIASTLLLIASAFLLFRSRKKTKSSSGAPPRSLVADFLEFIDVGVNYLAWAKYFCGIGPYFILSDIVTHMPYPIECSPYAVEECKAAVKWIGDVSDMTDEGRRYYTKAKFGELSCRVYPYSDAEHLRVACDWMNYIFRVDDWLDELDVEGNHKVSAQCIAALKDPIHYQTTHPIVRLTKSWAGRLEKLSSPALLDRMTQAMQEFFDALAEQAAHRDEDRLPDVEEYMALRRYSIGAFPAMVLIEFCGGYFVPDHIYNHPIIRSLQLAAIDHICWVNDLVSYNIEQARGDTHNLITIGMKYKGFNLQQAVDFVADNCNNCIDRFERDRQLVPSWGPELDKMVAIYVKGLQYWISGHLYWSFATGRYLPKEGMDIMNAKHNIVRLYPRLLSEETKT